MENLKKEIALAIFELIANIMFPTIMQSYFGVVLTIKQQPKRLSTAPVSVQNSDDTLFWSPITLQHLIKTKLGERVVDYILKTEIFNEDKEIKHILQCFLPLFSKELQLPLPSVIQGLNTVEEITDYEGTEIIEIPKTILIPKYLLEEIKYYIDPSWWISRPVDLEQ